MLGTFGPLKSLELLGMLGPLEPLDMFGPLGPLDVFGTLGALEPLAALGALGVLGPLGPLGGGVAANIASANAWWMGCAWGSATATGLPGARGGDGRPCLGGGRCGCGRCSGGAPWVGDGAVWRTSAARPATGACGVC
jgi:hypothetical protein